MLILESHFLSEYSKFTLHESAEHVNLFIVVKYHYMLFSYVSRAKICTPALAKKGCPKFVQIRMYLYTKMRLDTCEPRQISDILFWMEGVFMM